MIKFRLDPSTGVPPYLQIVQQVEQAMRVGQLVVGDRLPLIREVVAALVINPNTVHKAYRDLEARGLLEGRPGQGTYVRATLDAVPLATHTGLRKTLGRWVTSARAAGLDEPAIAALFATTLRDTRSETVA